ncbi:MAG: UPF0262 family protein [Defluviicoccus sp.]|uniref:Uncharacterized protein n=1 Tax=metagenome TaxID=256318 RepID=A0A380TMA7_9ZZZZ|nr:UPF0262 family protein [Defluviicoccus sp.]MDG4608229.1 UPF0262 family protein [Defluviicoccus sp.]SUS08879.1 conserved hypothetical protein [uncultured Defluviicoccus sp.]HOT83435.1 UPF0262 family protein [Candidatus Defluviicoccus seviourii]
MAAPQIAPCPRIANVVLEDLRRIRLSPQIEHERRSALYDLLENNHFRLINGAPGPYTVHLGLDGSKLVFRVNSDSGAECGRFTVALIEIKRLIKDYFLLCDSYFKAIKTMTPSRIEAIDMGRRGLHNEGAELLRERLRQHVEMDIDTARRLFTLVCVLHIRA